MLTVVSFFGSFPVCCGRSVVIITVVPGAGPAAPGTIDLFGKDASQPDDQACIQAELVNIRIGGDAAPGSIVAEIKTSGGGVDRGQELGFQLQAHPWRD